MKPEAIVKALAGVYTLVNTTNSRDGVPGPPNEPGRWKGFLVYTNTGYVSVSMTSYTLADLPNNGAGLIWPPPSDPSLDAGWTVVGKAVLTYAGPFSIDPAYPATKDFGGVIHGPLDLMSAPMLVGTLQRRNYTVVREKGKNGGVYLSLIVSQPDRGLQSVIWWRKVD
ncbi:hypothetical protein QBC38DRAFT_483095 [Podospora fimiseda]|uniref:Lipocalin-like domain-containing protein n=1 Tax=Podospora fimiseda TaxID=252190 RepID=A0AAN7BKR2_9PEZI|nr:hypothetical protein QBC38DRAFT_483095 [Podospora fimiseda]